MVATPADAPVSMPEVVTILAIPALLLLHVPPVMASLSSVASPSHTSETPLIKGGMGLTVTIAVVVQLP
jgi:hypothetical protein